MWVRNGGGVTPSDADLNAFALFLYNTYKARFLAHMHTSVVLEGCQLNYYGPSGLQIGGGHVENSSGAVTGTITPASAAICISWRVQQRYRGGHPRTYLTGQTSENMFSSQRWTTGWAQSYQSEANAFHAAVNAHAGGGLGDVHLGTVSFVLDGAWRSPPVFRDFTPTAASVDVRIDSQRRRLGPDL